MKQQDLQEPQEQQVGMTAENVFNSITIHNVGMIAAKKST